ncbi:MAG: ATP-binding protein [Caldilineaceae bacterium]|nr:ATP-binding protein [Caldilineaceae bacterium]
MGNDALVIFDPQAEQAVIGSVLIDDSTLTVTSRHIDASSFHLEKLAWIYQAMIDMQAKSLPVDMVTICDELARRNQLVEVGGSAYVMDLINAVPTAIHAEHYAKIVARDKLRREIALNGSRQAQLAWEETDEDKLISGAINLTIEATKRKNSSDPVPLSEILPKVVADAVAASKGVKPASLVVTGMASIDRTLGPMRGKNTYIVAARPGVGKSSLALAIAIHAAKKQGKKVAVFSMEMDKEEWVRRGLSAEVDRSATDIYLGNLGDLQEFHRGADRLSTPNLFIDDTPSLTPEALYVKADRVQKLYGLDLVIVDYIQLMQGEKLSRDRRVEVDAISRASKLMAMRLSIPVMNVAQLSRAVEMRSDPEPQLSDLREAGGLENDATGVVFLWREKDLQTEGQRYEVNWSVAKNRFGATGKGTVNFIPHLTQFVDVAPEPTPEESATYRSNLMQRCKALPNLSWQTWELGSGNEAMRRKVLLHRVQNDVVTALLNNQWVVFHGKPGVGKSLMARIVQTELIRAHGIPATYVNWRTLTIEVQRSWKDDTTNENQLREPLEAPVVIVDELDVNRLQNGQALWQAEQLYDLFDGSMALENAGKRRPLLLVLHMTPAQFAAELAKDNYGATGKSAANRLMTRSNLCVVDFAGISSWQEEPRF